VEQACFGERAMTVEPRPIRILAADDHPLLRDGIAAVIEAQSDMHLVAEAANGRDAVQRFREHVPDVTLMDLQMPGISGIEAIAEIRGDFPRARIVVLTTYEGDVQALRAFKAGASGYVLKSMVRKELLETIRAVHRGQRRIPPTIAAEMAAHFDDDVLSTRELDVLRLAAAGGANKTIGEKLGISEDTVKTHMRSVLAKLDANDRTHAVAIAARRGIISL
jgi:two-component system, NarL family, response regulator